MQKIDITRKLKRLILLRLLVVAFFLTIGAILFKSHALVYYGIFSSFLGLSLIYSFWLATERYLRTLVYVQMCLDIFFVTVAVHYTGGVDSVLATLYVLMIVGSGFLLFPGAPLIMSVLSSSFFSAVVLIDYFNWLPGFLPPIQEPFLGRNDWIYCLYMTYVRVTIFIIIGFLSEYLVRTVFKMEKNLKISERYSLIGEMAMHMAHEIKNPLMAISGSIEVLQDDLGEKLDPGNKKLMDAIVNESQRMKGIFEKVLDYARPETLDIKKFNLKEVLDEVFLLVEPSMINGHRVSVHPDYQRSDKAEIYVDRSRAKQVFMNLICNAIEAMPQGGDLTVRSEETSSETKVVFTDTGIGMNRQTQNELFVPFNSGKQSGHGIGLAIAYKIVRNHGGKIKVESKPGRGSTFVVSFPKP